jgi:RyR domain-containing protein
MAAVNLDFEHLAAGMHAGWLAYMRTAGYQWGEDRDDVRRPHPDLRPYDELSTASRRREHAIAAQLLSILTSTGYGLSKEESASVDGLSLGEAHRQLGRLLSIAAYEAWLAETRGSKQITISEAEWLDATSAHKRAQDLAAVGGLLDTVYELGLVVTKRGMD